MKLVKCYFCGEQLKGKRSCEHVFPQWLLDDFGIREEMINDTHYSQEGEVKSHRVHNLDNLLAGRICSHCNNGWMSELESKAKANVLALAEDNKVVVELDQKARFDLARWAFKTVLTLNLASNYRKIIPRDHYQWLFEHPDSLPKQVIVLAQQHHFPEPFYWIQSPSWFIQDKQDIINESMVKSLYTKSYKIALLFKHLLLLVAYQPFSELYYVIWRGIHIPLFPLKGPLLYYERDDFEWSDSVKSIIQFHGSLFLGTQTESNKGIQADAAEPRG